MPAPWTSSRTAAAAPLSLDGSCRARIAALQDRSLDHQGMNASVSSSRGSRRDVQPERQHAYELGVHQALDSHAKLDVAFYRKDARNPADVDQFFDTTVTFPLSVAKAVAQGVEARLDMRVYRGVSSYIIIARATILNEAPLTGGLFLVDPPAPGEKFYADHDQRWQSQFEVAYRIPNNRLFGSLTRRYDSGIPFFIGDDFDRASHEDQTALVLVNLDTGRANARAIINLLGGVEIFHRDARRVSLQAGVLNVFNTGYLLNFLSIFNGTHHGAPRTWLARARLEF